MRLFVFTAILLSLSTSFAAQDSVAVFYRPEKVIVLLNEKQGAPRLQKFMDAIGAEGSFVYESTDKALRINCARNDFESTCTFRILSESNMGKIGVKRAEAFVPATDIHVQSDYEMTFESSMGDRFHLKLNSKGLWYLGNKKGS